MAIALSQSEAEEKEKFKSKPSLTTKQSTSAAAAAKPTIDPEDLDPELVRYLDRDYWEQKEKEKEADKVKKTVSSSAAKPESLTSPVKSKATTSAKMVRSETDGDLDEFVTTLKTQMEIFVNRMKSNSSRGRSITNDSSVQTLFMNITAMHSTLLKHIQDQEDKRVHYEGLQDKLAQVKDARAALEALREEERERKRREAEEAERLRQNQMREKLELMRKKKTEYLQYQRQLALQRMHEEEREMMLRHEQSRQQYQPQMFPGAPPAMYNPYFNPAAPGPGGAPPYMMAPPNPGQQVLF